jgi:hypothetical protein
VGTVGARSATAALAAALSFARSWMMVVSPRAMRSIAPGSCLLISRADRTLRSGRLACRATSARVSRFCNFSPALAAFAALSASTSRCLCRRASSRMPSAISA